MTTENQANGTDDANEEVKDSQTAESGSEKSQETTQKSEAEIANEIIAKQAEYHTQNSADNAQEESADDKSEKGTDDNQADDNKDYKGEEKGKEGGETIDQKLVEAGHAVGMSDDEIIDMATDNPEALKSIAQIVAAEPDNSQKPAAKDAVKGEEKSKDPEKSADEIEPDLSKYDPELVEEVIKPMLEEQKRLRGALKKAEESEEKAEEQQRAGILDALNKDFDTLSDTFPVLGSTEKMNEGQFKLRQGILDEALALVELPSVKKSGKEWPEILTIAATSLLGKPDGKSKSKSGKPTDATGVKKLFTHRPSGRKAQSDKPKSENARHEQLVESIGIMQEKVR